MKEERQVNSIRLWIFFVCVLLMTGGCASFEVRDFDLEPPSSTKIPLRVGLYMSTEFRNYRTYGLGADQRLGDGMRQAAERTVKLVFEDVVLIDSVSSIEIPRIGIKAIISPEIVGAVLLQNLPFLSRYQITCKWTIWTPDGKIAYMNTFRGEGTDNSFVGTTRIDKSMTLAAKEQYQKFLVHILSTKWWEAIR
jgi:hypothetical protein